MKKYLVLKDSVYEGCGDVSVIGLFSDLEKAKKKFNDSVYWAKYDLNLFDEDDEESEYTVYTDSELCFYAYQEEYELHYKCHIWIEEVEEE